MKYKKHYTDKEKERIISIGPKGSGCTVEIPDKITEISSENFSNCKNLKIITLPKNIKKNWTKRI